MCLLCFEAGTMLGRHFPKSSGNRVIHAAIFEDTHFLLIRQGVQFLNLRGQVLAIVTKLFCSSKLPSRRVLGPQIV